jgi:hypothetical protein
VSWLRATADGVALDVLVQPRASRPKLGPIHGDRIKVAVTAPPVDGGQRRGDRAGGQVLGVARGAVAVTAGQASRRKTLVIRGVDLARVTAVVEAA